MTRTLADIGTHLRVLRESYLMNTNMTGLDGLCVLVLWTRAASALEGLMSCIEKRQTVIPGFVSCQ